MGIRMKRIITIFFIFSFVMLFFFSPSLLQAKEKLVQLILRADALVQEEQLQLVDSEIEVEEETAEENQQEETQKVRINLQDGLSFQEAYELAMLNSIELKQAEYDLENATEQFDDVKNLKKIKPTDQFPYVDAMGNVIMVSNPDQKLQMEISKEITYYQVKNAKELVEKQITLEKQNIKTKVEDQMITYAKAEEALNLAQINASRVEKLSEITKHQFELGMVDKSALLDSEVAMSQAKMGVDNARRQLSIAKENFFLLLGLKASDEIVIEKLDPVDMGKEISINQLDALLEAAFQHRIDYLMQKDQVEYEKTRFEIYDEHYTYYGNKQDIIRRQEIAYQKEELNLLSMERSIYIQLYQVVTGLDQTKGQLDSLALNVEQAKEALRIVQLRYEAGLSITLEMVSAQAALAQAENNLLDGKYQIMTMKNNLESALGETVDQALEIAATEE